MGLLPLVMVTLEVASLIEKRSLLPNNSADVAFLSGAYASVAIHDKGPSRVLIIPPTRGLFRDIKGKPLF